MKTAQKTLLIIYLAVLLVLSFLPLTGYYAALGALPVLCLYLYRRFILESEAEAPVLTRGVFLLAFVVFVFGFVLNLFCTLYTTYRMAEFKSGIEEQKKKIYGEPGASEATPIQAPGGKNAPSKKK